MPDDWLRGARGQPPRRDISGTKAWGQIQIYISISNLRERPVFAPMTLSAVDEKMEVREALALASRLASDRLKTRQRVLGHVLSQGGGIVRAEAEGRKSAFQHATIGKDQQT